MTLLVWLLAAWAVWQADMPAAVVCAGLSVWRGYRGPGRVWGRVVEVVGLRRSGVRIGDDEGRRGR